MRNRIVVTAMSITLAVIGGIMLAVNIPSPIDHSPDDSESSQVIQRAEPTPDFISPDTPLDDEVQTGYYLREFEGRIAVFEGDEFEPDYVLDVYLQYLPEYDREQLSQGIYVDTYEQLLTLMEDYSS